jgi:hypothetical protein
MWVFPPPPLSIFEPTDHFLRNVVYYIYYFNDGGSSSVGDADRHVTTRNLLDYIFNILPV